MMLKYALTELLSFFIFLIIYINLFQLLNQSHALNSHRKSMLIKGGTARM